MSYIYCYAAVGKTIYVIKKMLLPANNEFGARQSNRAIARSAIVDHVKATGIAAGIIDCPVCKVGKLQYSQAVGYNDHVHALCLTLKCVGWAE